MKRRAEAAEESADAAARASAEALARAEASEAQLKKQLADLADSVDDAAVAEVVADATAAVAEVAAKASAGGKKPALSRMRKADLILECEARGLAFEGLKVPELRVLLGARARRTIMRTDDIRGGPVRAPGEHRALVRLPRVAVAERLVRRGDPLEEFRRRACRRRADVPVGVVRAREVAEAPLDFGRRRRRRQAERDVVPRLAEA